MPTFPTAWNAGTQPEAFVVKGRFLHRVPPDKAPETAVLAANQGWYNGFLAAGLACGLLHSAPAFGFQIKVFFLLCMIVTGIYGAVTVSRRILYVQAAPAAIALILLWLA